MKILALVLALTISFVAGIIGDSTINLVEFVAGFIVANLLYYFVFGKWGS